MCPLFIFFKTFVFFQCYFYKKIILNKDKTMDTLGIEPNTSRMLSERDNQLHHVPLIYS